METLESQQLFKQILQSKVFIWLSYGKIWVTWGKRVINGNVQKEIKAKILLVDFIPNKRYVIITQCYVQK